MTAEHIDAGQLKERLTVLTLEEVSAGRFVWSETRRTWGAAVPSAKKNIWSAHGVGAAGATFTLRRQELTLGNALLWRGQHCFLTDIRPFGRTCLTVTAALVEVLPCEDKRAGAAFPGVLTEKYLGHDQLEPQAVNTLRYVLATPKPILLTPGRLVEVDGLSCPVQVAHVLDPWHNEYEIERTVDL